MKNFALLLLSLFFFSFIYGQSDRPISDAQYNIIFEKTKDFPEGTELSFALIKDGVVGYYGVKRIGDTLEYVDNARNTFEIGSISKVFTSTLLAHRVLEGEMDLSAPIQEYIDFPIKNKDITIRQLANHTSGLPRLPSNLDLEKTDPFNPYKDYDTTALKFYLQNDMKLDNDPGENYSYSNLGAGLLGYILELQSGLSYEELLQKNIASPYTMESTTTDRLKVDSILVQGIDGNGKATSNWDLNVLVGAGGIVSNAIDLSKFALAQFNKENKALVLTREQTFEVPEYKLGLGLAWNIIQPDTSHTWYMHNGGTGGYTSMLALDVENKNGVIILSNVSAFHKQSRNIDQIALGLMKALYVSDN